MRSMVIVHAQYGWGCESGFSENYLSCIARNFGAKCPFLIVLGLFESLDIDLYNGTGPIKKYSLSSEIQLIKVGHISKKSGKSQILRQDKSGFTGFGLQKCSPNGNSKDKC